MDDGKGSHEWSRDAFMMACMYPSAMGLHLMWLLWQPCNLRMWIYQGPAMGAHTHAQAHQHPCPWVLGGHGCDIFVHGWAWVGMGSIL